MNVGLLAAGIAMILIGVGIAAWVYSPQTDQAYNQAYAVNRGCESRIGDIGELIVPEFTHDVCSNASQIVTSVEIGQYAAPSLLTFGAAATIAGVVLWFQEGKKNKGEQTTQEILEDEMLTTESVEDRVYCRYCGKQR